MIGSSNIYLVITAYALALIAGILIFKTFRK